MTMRSQAIVTLHDLGVDGRRAVLLLDTFGDLDAVLAADHERLTSIPTWERRRRSASSRPPERADRKPGYPFAEWKPNRPSTVSLEPSCYYHSPSPDNKRYHGVPQRPRA